MNADAIPAELRALDRWVVWRWEPDPEDPEKLKKPPYMAADPGRHASSTRPETWSTFEQALAVVQAGEADGVGYALEPPHVGIDLDEELPEPDKGAIILTLNSYTERSPSHKAYHVVVRANLNGHGRHPPGIGVFQRDRLFYFTGDHVEHTPTTIEERQAELDTVLAQYMPATEPAPAPAPAARLVTLDDQLLLAKAKQASNGADFAALWNGDTSRYDGDDSRADLALCSHLAFWTGRDPGQIDRIFRASGLMRDKWDERRGESTYGAQTIAKAVDGTHETYQPLQPHPQVAAASNDTSPVFVTLREFLKIKFPPAESLVGVGRRGTNLLPRYGWVMIWGPEGSGKTSVVSDLVAHTAAGLDWCVYPTLRETRWTIVVNEGVPGGLQDKLAQKFEGWDDTHQGILDRIAVYKSPWGAFTLQNERMLAHLRDYAHDFQADYIALDPLHTVGTVGAGSPQDTEQFKHLLRQLGLWESLGILTPHHSNKAGMVSGDWGRHPDTLIRLEKDGARPATRYTLQKARPADPAELGVVQLLEWETDTLGYRRIQDAALAPKQIKAANKEMVLEAAGEGMHTIAEIALRTGLSERTVAGHLKTLEAERELTLAKGARGKLTVIAAGGHDTLEDALAEEERRHPDA